MAGTIIVVGNEKGGTGKSTLAMHLIACFLKEGKKVSSVDLDGRQGTLTHYIQNRAAFAERHGIALDLPEHLSVTVRDIYMDGARLAVCAHIEPREPDAFRLLSETDIGTDGEHFDRIWWQGKVLSFDEWLREGKEMLVVSGAVLQIGDTRLPVSVDWVPQDQGETFSFEAELALLGEAPFKENDGMMEATLLIQSHLSGEENEQSSVTFAFAAPQ